MRIVTQLIIVVFNKITMKGLKHVTNNNVEMMPLVVWDESTAVNSHRRYYEYFIYT